MCLRGLIGLCALNFRIGRIFSLLVLALYYDEVSQVDYFILNGCNSKSIKNLFFSVYLRKLNCSDMSYCFLLDPNL